MFTSCRFHDQMIDLSEINFIQLVSFRLLFILKKLELKSVEPLRGLKREKNTW